MSKKGMYEGGYKVGVTPKKDKYNVQQGKGQKITIDGYVLDSRIEAKYYTDIIKPKLKSGEMKSFTFHPKFILQDKVEKNGQKVRAITYEADFEEVYEDRTVVVDVKGMETQQGLMRRKMFNYRYRELELLWISYSPKFGGWIEYDLLNKMRREANKKKKESVLNAI